MPIRAQQWIAFLLPVWLVQRCVVRVYLSMRLRRDLCDLAEDIRLSDLAKHLGLPKGAD